MNQRRVRWLLLILMPTLLVAVLWLFWVQSRVPEPDLATAEALEMVAGEWWRPGGPYRTIPEAEWPPELRRLGPRSVRVAAEGVFIRFGSLYVEEWGLFVLPAGSGFRPQPNTDPSFRAVRGRVFKYDIKG
jgi:hypothetical protein